jgi:hypothetical protein
MIKAYFLMYTLTDPLPSRERELKGDINYISNQVYAIILI